MKLKTIKIFLLCFCIGIAPVSLVTQGEKAYADNTTNITFEIAEPENSDESDYEDIEGEGIIMWEAGQDWVIGKSSKSVVTFYLAREKFVSIALDDQELTEGQEFSISGNTTISFKKSYLDTLPEGRHDIIARFSGLDDEEENSLFSTYLTVYTEESAAAAGIVVPDTGFFAAVGEIATGSLPVVSFVGIATLCIIVCIRFYASIKKAITRIQKRISSTFRIVFRRPAQRYLPLATKKLHYLKPSSQTMKLAVSILAISAATSGFGVLFHQLSHKQSDAASTINLEVDTSSDIKGTLLYSESIARAVDTINVETEPGVEYDIYMSAGNDNQLRADGTDKTFGENTNVFSLSEGSWGFNTEANGSVFSTVPKKGKEVLVAHGTEPGETKVYFAAKAGEGFATGAYHGTVRYTIIAKSENPISVNPGSGSSSNTVTITTPIAKNGDMTIEIPNIKIGDNDCLSPNLQATDNQYITVTCTIPDDLTPGNYDVSLDFSDIEQELNVKDAYTEPEPESTPTPEPEPTPDPEPDPNPEPTPDPGPAPDPEPDPEPEPEIVYYTVTSGPSNATYGSTNRTSMSVAAGTTFTSSGNKLTFSDGRTIVATPKTITGYNTSCSGWSPASGTVNNNMSVTANCTATIIQYKVTVKVNNSNYGTADASEIWVPYNTTFTSSGNTMSFSNGRTIKATPINATGYTTTCGSWSPSNGTVTGNITVTANCARSANNYTMTFRVNDTSLGTVSASSVSIPYNTNYSSSGGTLTFANGTKVTVSPKTLTGYTVTCSSWSPSSGKVTANTTFTAICTKKAKVGRITYVSAKGATKTADVSNGDKHAIRALAEFAKSTSLVHKDSPSGRYSNIYSLNTETYKNWTKEGYYFDYWTGSDGNKYSPAAEDDGHDPYYQCTNCKHEIQSDGSDITLTAHYTKMNNLNLAAITLAWPDGYTSNDTMVASNKSEGWSHYVTPSSPYNKKMERYKVASTPEFRSNAAKYYTDANRRASIEANSLASNKCDNYHSLGCSGSWYTDDIGYIYARSCDRTAAIATYYGIKGLGNTTIKIPFGLPAQAKYFARGDQPWTATNTKNNSRTSTSVTGTASNMGRYETHYQPGDIRLVYRETSKHDSYKLNYDGKTYTLGHIAMYVKTEDGLSHIAEGGHAEYKKNSSSYTGDFIFANTAYTKGGSFDHLSPFYYKTTAQGFDKNEWYAIWRYNGSGN